MNKTIVITGAGGILCGIIAKHLAKNGAKVALLDINLDAAESLASSLRAEGLTAKAYKADVLSVDSVSSVLNLVEKELGEVDILINGAGGNSPKATTQDEFFDSKNADIKDFFSMKKEDISFVFDLNLIGTLIPTQIFAKKMAEKGKGTILNISSMNAFTPLTKIPAYSAAKSAVSNFTQWLAVYFAKTGLRVNAIAPGFFATNQNKTLLFNADGTLTERSKKIIRNTPMERFGKPEELLGAVDFLIDDEKSGFITGVILPIDGGFNAYSGV